LFLITCCVKLIVKKWSHVSGETDASCVVLEIRVVIVGRRELELEELLEQLIILK